jgi:hypothetical protein
MGFYRTFYAEFSEVISFFLKGVIFELGSKLVFFFLNGTLNSVLF